MQSGSIVFNSSKKAIIIFSSPFAKVPRINMSQMDTSISNPYTSTVSKTGFTLNFVNPFTGTVEWVALERE